MGFVLFAVMAYNWLKKICGFVVSRWWENIHTFVPDISLCFILALWHFIYFFKWIINITVLCQQLLDI